MLNLEQPKIETEHFMGESRETRPEIVEYSAEEEQAISECCDILETFPDSKVALQHFIEQGIEVVHRIKTKKIGTGSM